MRLTLDLDNVSFNHARKKAQLISFIFKTRTEVWKSSNKKNGYHVIGYDIRVSWEQIMQMRSTLGDDVRRINYDHERRRQNIPTQVLFTEKKGGESKLLEEYICGQRMK